MLVKKYHLILVSTLDISTNAVNNYVLSSGTGTDNVLDIVLNDDENIFYIRTDSYVF